MEITTITNHAALAEKTTQRQERPGDCRSWWIWELITPLHLEVRDLGDIQAKKGYHPCGYGLYKNTKEDLGDGTFKYTWKCSHTCD